MSAAEAIWSKKNDNDGFVSCINVDQRVGQTGARGVLGSPLKGQTRTEKSNDFCSSTYSATIQIWSVYVVEKQNFEFRWCHSSDLSIRFYTINVFTCEWNAMGSLTANIMSIIGWSEPLAVCGSYKPGWLNTPEPYANACWIGGKFVCKSSKVINGAILSINSTPAEEITDLS